MKVCAIVPLACIAASATCLARADDGVLPDQTQATDDASRHRIDRTWIYADDGRIAAPMTAIATSSVSYTAVGSSPTRIVSPYPDTYNGFAGNTAQPGGMIGIGAEVGLLPRLAVMAVGQLGMGGVDGVPSPSAGGLVGVRVQVLPDAWRSTHLVLGAGYLREAWSGPVFDDDSGKWLPGSPRGDNGAWIQVAFVGDVQRLRLGATLHGEHIFWAGRDPLDVMVDLGATYRVAGDLRLGAEYVGQDLEEALSPGAEGGARHFIGPTVSWQGLDQRLSLVAGPSVGLSPLSPSFVARVAASYAF